MAGALSLEQALRSASMQGSRVMIHIFFISPFYSEYERRLLMKDRKDSLIYSQYRNGQIARAEFEEDLFLFARKLVKAKDDLGLNLFWDAKEEHFLRRFLEHAETSGAC